MIANVQYMMLGSVKMPPFCFSGGHFENGKNRDGQR